MRLECAAVVIAEESTRFVGREADLARLGRLFSGGTRLITLAGPGGVGKTRLARRFAASRDPAAFPGGIQFVDLSDARDAHALCGMLGAALGVALTSGDALSQLAQALAAR